MLKDNLNNVLKNVEIDKIVAATKYVDSATMRELYSLGVKNFGENRTDSFLIKYDELNDLDITWHFIGTLQTRKVKDVINKIEYLHSLDRITLADEIEKRSNKVIKCFIEVNISNEDSKQGMYINDVIDFANKIVNYEKIEVIGLMGMAMNTKDDNEIMNQFNLLVNLKNKVNRIIPSCQKLSMGMSGDYKIALQCGSDYVRLGSILFKEELK